MLHPRLQALQQQVGVSILTPVQDLAFSQRGLQVSIKRDDLLHPIISGNKWRKLKYVLDDALRQNAGCIVSMGGAYSNHLHALAFIGRVLGLKTRAFIRGERPAVFNPTLRDLQAWQMDLQFVSRSEYRQLRDYQTADSLPGLRAGEYWLPEGGATALALKGVAEIWSEIHPPCDVLMLACGTGTTLAGLLQTAPADAQIWGVAALKGAGFLRAATQDLAGVAAETANWQILLDYHFGGFARFSPQLLAFMHSCSQQHGVPLEPVYTAKALFALYDQLAKEAFKPGQHIVLLHTGGLQGWRPDFNPAPSLPPDD